MSEDSVQAHISFQIQDHEVVLRYDSLDQPYLFTLEKDSASVQGLVIQWPPLYCLLEPVDKQRMVIAYSSSSSDQVVKVPYKRE